MDRELPIRVTVIEPPLGVTFAMQRGKDELKPDDRFLYLNSGTMAGQQNSCWTRRAKIKTAGISWKLVEQTFAAPGAVLEVQVDGHAKDGGPCCATVPLVNGGWKVCPTKTSTRHAKTRA